MPGLRRCQGPKLHQVLSDGKPHSTVEILQRVYGTSHSDIGRIGARILDLKARGCQITSWPDPENKAIWFYQMAVKPKPRMEYVEKDGAMYARLVE